MHKVICLPRSSHVFQQTSNYLYVRLKALVLTLGGLAALPVSERVTSLMFDLVRARIVTGSILTSHHGSCTDENLTVRYPDGGQQSK